MAQIVRVEVTRDDGTVEQLTGEGAAVADGNWEVFNGLPWQDITPPKGVELEVDPERQAFGESGTGVFVRATHNGHWGNHDIVTLKRESMLAWLRSRGGRNEWAEHLVLILLGYPRDAGPVVVREPTT